MSFLDALYQLAESTTAHVRVSIHVDDDAQVDALYEELGEPVDPRRDFSRPETREFDSRIWRMAVTNVGGVDVMISGPHRPARREAA